MIPAKETRGIERKFSKSYSRCKTKQSNTPKSTHLRFSKAKRDQVGQKVAMGYAEKNQARECHMSKTDSKTAGANTSP